MQKVAVFEDGPRRGEKQVVEKWGTIEIPIPVLTEGYASESELDPRVVVGVYSTTDRIAFATPGGELVETYYRFDGVRL